MMRRLIGAFGKRHRYRYAAAVELFDHRPDGAARAIGDIRGILGALR